MKPVYVFLLLECFYFSVMAQPNTTVNDALLLEYYQNQRYQEAADYLKTTYPEPVTDLEVLSKLAFASQMAGKLADADNYYKRMYDADSTNTSLLFHLGAINLRRGNNLKAKAYYKKIIEKDTVNFIVYKQLSKISFEEGKQADMISYLLKANKLNPAEPDVATDLSDILVNLKKYDQAQHVLNTAFAADPENVELLMSSQNNFLETKQACLELMNLGNRSGYVLTQLGAAYFNLKDYECSAATFADITEKEQGETSYYTAGLAYQALKDQFKAIENFSKAIKVGISPNIASYYGEIADSQQKLHKYNYAAQAYKKALQFNDEPILYYLLANLYDTRLKDERNAVKYYKKYLTSKPTGKYQTYIAYAKSRVEYLKNER